MSDLSAKSSWIYCVALSLLLVALPGALEAKKKKPRSPEELTNFLLGPDRATWLVGAISRIATDAEIGRYLRLTSDDEAAGFIEEFWSKRRSDKIAWPNPQPQGIYETRAREADTRYAEGARAGRRSDRGTIHILYGTPEKVDYEVSSRPGSGNIEVWSYPKGAEEGLDGERPKRTYYFVKRGEYTVESPPPPRQRLRPRADGR